MKKIILLLFFIITLFAKININTATMEELHSLKGIGHTKAVAIMEYRKKHPFKKIEDIMKIKGIGKKTFEKIKDDITVEWWRLEGAYVFVLVMFRSDYFINESYEWCDSKIQKKIGLGKLIVEEMSKNSRPLRDFIQKIFFWVRNVGFMLKFLKFFNIRKHLNISRQTASKYLKQLTVGLLEEKKISKSKYYINNKQRIFLSCWVNKTKKSIFRYKSIHF